MDSRKISHEAIVKTGDHDGLSRDSDRGLGKVELGIRN